MSSTNEAEAAGLVVDAGGAVAAEAGDKVAAEAGGVQAEAGGVKAEQLSGYEAEADGILLRSRDHVRGGEGEGEGVREHVWGGEGEGEGVRAGRRGEVDAVRTRLRGVARRLAAPAEELAEVLGMTAGVI